MPATISYKPLYRKLVLLDLRTQLPGVSKTSDECDGELTKDEIRQLIGLASIASTSSSEVDQIQAYEIVTRLIELEGNDDPILVAVVDIILSRIGNFPGRNLLRERYGINPGEVPPAPFRLSLERTVREIENSVSHFNGTVALTDFQYELFETLDEEKSISVSAPTSAGKSFVMGLDLIRRLQKGGPACVVYVVPTRALIREVTQKLRTQLRQVGMDTVLIRSVPFPIPKEKALDGAVFVLTQERLMSLLHSPQWEPWITTIIIDEAQNIQDGARGIILQSAIEAALRKLPGIDIHFASPLIKNPEYLLQLFGRDKGKEMIGHVSPVSQNLILVSEVYGKSTFARFETLIDNERLDLGVRDLGFSLRNGTFQRRAAFAKAITGDDESTILYANRAGDTEELADALVQQLHDTVPLRDHRIEEFVEFLANEIHPEYPLINALPYRVAFHYGDMPAIVRSRVEDLFKDGILKYVCCTSTLLQGVNLPARHIVIENPKRGIKNAMQRKDFLNLAGRAGRLMQEFHGNIWCLRPGKWDEESYQGEKLQEIHSALSEVMMDGGTAIQRVISNESQASELDLAEAAFGKVYSDFIISEQSLTESEFRTEENAEVLALTAQQCESLDITLPAHILDINRSVRPDRLQDLYTYLSLQLDIFEFLPIKPNAPGSNYRMETIIRVLQEQLADENNFRYKYYNFLASRWVHNTPLKLIISDHVAYRRSKDDTRSTSAIIRELLGDLESIVRFRLVKYFVAYTSILEYILQEREEHEIAANIEPFHIYLECGASDHVTLNLIALGFSRVTALAIKSKVNFGSDASPEQCLSQLNNIDTRTLNIPALCIRELEEVIGRN